MHGISNRGNNEVISGSFCDLTTKKHQQFQDHIVLLTMTRPQLHDKQKISKSNFTSESVVTASATGLAKMKAEDVNATVYSRGCFE